MSDRTTYRVRWEIDIDAESPMDAAERALAIHRNPESIATVFEVFNREIDEHYPVATVDLHQGEVY